MQDLRFSAKAAIFVAISLISAELSQGQSSSNFFAGINYPAGVTPSEVAVGLGYFPGFLPIQIQTADFNGDGKLDIVAVGACEAAFSSLCDDSEGYAVAIYLGNGDGTFQKPIVGGPVNPVVRSLLVADFNRDGNLDVVVQADDTSEGVFPNITVLLGDGHGNLAKASNYSLAGASNYSTPANLASGDFNGDGKPDLAVSSDCSGPTCTVGNAIVQVFIGNGDGTFQSPVLYSTGVTNATPAVLSADFNGDGNLDLVLISSTAPGDPSHASVTFLQGTGGGAFLSPVTTALTVQAAQNAVTGDFNADGKLDVAFVDPTTSLNVLFGRGNGSFQTPVSYALDPSATYPASLFVSDFNSDGKPDLVVAEASSSNRAALLLNDGTGTFTVAHTYPLGGENFPTVVAGDFNGDGKADIVLSSFEAQPVSEVADGSISILLGNGDGSMQAASQFTLTPSPQSLVTADLNADGIADLLGTETCYQGNCDNQQGGVLVSLGLGNGAFAPPVEYPAGMPVYSPNGLTVGDVNGDGKADVVISGSGVAIMLGVGGGSLGTAVVYPTADTVTGPPVLGDFTGKGKLGVAVMHPTAAADGSGSVGVLLGNGDGTLQPEVITLTPDIQGFSLTVGDFNHDGKADVAALGLTVSSPAIDAFTVLLGNGDGSLYVSANQNAIPNQICEGSATAGVCLPSYPAGGTTPTGIATADMDGDGNLDLIVANECANGDTYCSTGSVAVLLGAGNGAFAYSDAAYPVPDAKFLGVSVQDINGDGIPDIVAPTFTGVVVWRGTGSPFLTGEATVYAGLALSMPTAPAIADFNGDGSADIALTNGSAIAILYNRASGGSTAPIATTTAIASSPNPSVYGMPVTLTATVTAPGQTLPTGTVTFNDGGTVLGSAALSGGTATIVVSGLAAAPHSISAAFSGSTKFAPGSSSVLSQTIDQATSMVSLASAASPAYVNQPVILTATVKSQYGAAVTGTVAIYQGKQLLATVPLAGGAAAYSATFTTAGTKSLTAAYSGDSNDAGSTSSVLQQPVKNLPAATTTSVTTSLSPSLINQSVTFIATVTSTFGAIPNGETVSFYDGGTLVGTGVTAGGAAGFSTSQLTAKQHTVKATYAGDSDFKISSGTVGQMVTLYASTTGLTSSLNPSIFGQSVSLSAAVSSSAPGGPTGTVTFKNGTTTLGTATLSGGIAVLVSAKLPVGTLGLTAVYKGDAQSGTSSGTTNQVVTQAVTTTTITSSRNPSKASQAVKLTANVVSPSTTPTGTVTFTDGATVLATVNLAGGAASFTTSALSTGSHNINATYNGNSNVTGSTTSTPLLQVVN